MISEIKCETCLLIYMIINYVQLVYCNGTNVHEDIHIR